jgi:hypothetical protein
MQIEIATATVAPPEPTRADRLAEVLLPELVRTLAAEGEAGTVLGGRPHLRLFGEAIDLALPLRALRRLGEAASGASLCIDDDTLALHGRATAAAEGYLVSAAGMYSARRRGSGRDEGVPADAMSLRLQTASFCYPMNALLRADPARPQAWLSVVAGLRGAVQRHLGRGDVPPEHPFARRLQRLRAALSGLLRLDDPRLPRLLGELLVHALMAAHALGRQRPLVRDGTQPDRLYRACVLPEAALADLRWAAGEHGVWRDPGLASCSPRAAQCRWFGRAHHPHALEIRPLFRSSAGRWLDGTVDDVVSHEPVVMFPPGTPFEVVEVVETSRDGGPPRITARLVELSPRAGASHTPGGPRRASRAPAGPLYHYTFGRALPGIAEDGEIGVAEALPGTDAPVVWLSTRASFEPSVARYVLEDGRRRELGPAELAARGQGLFRIEVDPAIEAMPWRELLAWAEVPDAVARQLEQEARERGADPDDWWCSPTAVPRSRWAAIELWHPRHGWVPVEPQDLLLLSGLRRTAG